MRQKKKKRKKKKVGKPTGDPVGGRDAPNIYKAIKINNRLLLKYIDLYQCFNKSLAPALNGMLLGYMQIEEQLAQVWNAK